MLIDPSSYATPINSLAGVDRTLTIRFTGVVHLKEAWKETQMLPIAAVIGTRLTRDQAQSARPDAPVIPDEDTHRRESLMSRVLGVAQRRAGRGITSSASPTNPRHAW
jgi:hypothetical protein